MSSTEDVVGFKVWKTFHETSCTDGESGSKARTQRFEA
jgi:hypothetical protein